jgi:hypothetical protein
MCTSDYRRGLDSNYNLLDSFAHNSWLHFLISCCTLIPTFHSHVFNSRCLIAASTEDVPFFWVPELSPCLSNINSALTHRLFYIQFVNTFYIPFFKHISTIHSHVFNSRCLIMAANDISSFLLSSRTVSVSQQHKLWANSYTTTTFTTRSILTRLKLNY